jgi:hypothetical protein
MTAIQCFFFAEICGMPLDPVKPLYCDNQYPDKNRAASMHARRRGDNNTFSVNSGTLQLRVARCRAGRNFVHRKEQCRKGSGTSHRVP